MNLVPSIIGALSNNFIRGGGIKAASFFAHVKDTVLRIINAAIYGGFGWLYASSWVVGLFLFLGMMIGSIPGWRQYIIAMTGEDNKDDAGLGYGLMTVRGIFWGFSIAAMAMISFWITGIDMLLAFSILTLACSALMGTIYFLEIKLNKVNNKLFNYWVCSERIFGFILWMPLCVLSVK